jgi:hypothetical protein
MEIGILHSCCMDLIHAWLNDRLGSFSAKTPQHWNVHILPPCAPLNAIVLPYSAVTTAAHAKSSRVITLQLHNYELYTQLMIHSDTREALMITFAADCWSIATDSDATRYHLTEFTDLFLKAAAESQILKKPLPWLPTSGSSFAVRQWLDRIAGRLDAWLETRLVYFVTNPFSRHARAKQLAQIHQVANASSTTSLNNNLETSMAKTGLPDDYECQMHARVIAFLNATKHH